MMMTAFIPGAAPRARRDSPMTAGTRRIAHGLAPICRVPPICDPRRDQGRGAAAGAAP
jgi:hypothetical protein